MTIDNLLFFIKTESVVMQELVLSFFLSYL